MVDVWIWHLRAGLYSGGILGVGLGVKCLVKVGNFGGLWEVRLKAGGGL